MMRLPLFHIRVNIHQWGYREFDPGLGRLVEVLPAEVTGIETWNHNLAYLRDRFSQWRFE